jgi:hypothetical protein
MEERTMKFMNDDLLGIFHRLKELMMKYESPLIAKIDNEGRYDLWSIKDVVINNRKKKEVYFAGLMIQKDYVGFYYMPIYSDVDIKGVFGQELLKRLKGKSCFHIKKLDEVLVKQIIEALEIGYSLYKDRGWI